MANNTEKYKKIVEKSAEIDSMDLAIETLEAFHKLEAHGGDELEVLRFEYVNNCIENTFLERAFEYHLKSCFNCLQKTANLKHFAKASVKYGDKVIVKVETEELAGQITVLLGGVQQNVKRIQDTFLSNLSESGRLVIKLGEKIIFDENVEESQIILPPDPSFSYGLKEQKPSVTFRHSGYVIEVRPGQDGGKLTIKITDNSTDG